MVHFMLFSAVIGFILYFVLAYLSMAGNARRVLIVLAIAYPLTLIGTYILVRFNRSIPREFKLSEEGLSLKFRKRVRSYAWQDIRNLSIRRVRLYDVLAIELNDGRVDQIHSLTTKSRRSIITYAYRKSRGGH